MIGFEIKVNDKIAATVGARDLIALNAVLAVCGDPSTPEATSVTYMTAIAMANGSSKETMRMDRWEVAPCGRSFLIGDTVTIRIVEIDRTSKPDASEEMDREEDVDSP